MHAIDTSLLYALFDEADKWHEDAGRLVQEHRPVAVPPGTLQETLDLLAFRHGPKAARAAEAWLAAQDAVLVAGDDAGRSFDRGLALFREEEGLSFADAWCVAHALVLEVPLLTKDRRQEAAWRVRRRAG